MTAVVHVGNVLDILPTLEAGSVNCVVTSPPYWGLRDYGTAQWDGGDAGCDHVSLDAERTPWANSVPGPAGATAKNAKGRNETKERGGTCAKCGATRIDSQLGLEPTPELYVANMVAVFREVRRVLRDDGTLWLNLGDSYNANQGAGFNGQKRQDHANRHTVMPRPDWLKPKDLVGIPWMVAFALRADGWYLRSDIIWSKPNPMPESVTDRPTKAHEYVFLLTKSARYWYDADAIKEGATYGRCETTGGSMYGRIREADPRDRRGNAPNATSTAHPETGRNRRTVWTIATQPYPEAHFATYPEKLVEPCVMAGCPVGGTVLDPFTGSGTTGAVACRLGRSFIGIELSPEYAEMAERRIAPHRDQMQMVVV